MTRVLLSEVATFQSGGTPSKNVVEYWRGEIPWVSPKDMGQERISDASDRISTGAVAQSATKIVQPGTVLVVTRSGVLKHTLPIAIADKEVAFNQDIKAIFPNRKRLEPEYLMWALREKEPLILSRGVKMGATVHSLSSGFLESLSVHLPPLDEQRRIVDLLNRASAIRRLAEAARTKARDLIPALFVDMFGDPATNPKGWPVATIDDLCTLVRGSSPRPQGDPRFFGGPVPRLMIADITRDGTYVTPKVDSLTELGATKSRPMPAGSVVMAVSGAVGLPAILAIDACIHDGFVGFRDLSKKIDPTFLYCYLEAVRGRSQAQGIGATFQNINTAQIKQWRVPLPPAKMQQAFADLVAEARSQLGLAERAGRTAEALTQSIMAKVFAA